MSFIVIKANIENIRLAMQRIDTRRFSETSVRYPVNPNGYTNTQCRLHTSYTGLQTIEAASREASCPEMKYCAMYLVYSL